MLKILLVDDIKSARESLVAFLRKQSDFRVKACANSEQTVRALQSDSFDVLVLDWVLKDSSLTGEQILAKVRRDYDNLKIIVLSGQSSEAHDRALAMGAARAFELPLDRMTLVSTIREVSVQESSLHKMIVDARHLLDADDALLWRLDPRERKLRIFDSAGVSVLDDKDRRIVLDLDAAATRKLFKTGKPVFLSNVRSAKKAPYYRHRINASRHGWASLISIPLQNNDQVVGLVDIYTRNRMLKLEQIEPIRKYLKAWGDQATETLRGADLLEQTRALEPINQVLSGPFDLKVVLGLVLAQALKLTRAEAGWVYGQDLETNALELLAAKERDAEKAPRIPKPGERIIRKVAREGTTTIFSAKASKDKLAMGVGQHRGLTSLIAIPLRLEESTIGVFLLASRFRNAFSHSDARLLTPFVQLSSQALSQARLVERLHELSTPSQRSMQELANDIVRITYSLLGKPVSFWLLDDEGKVLSIRAGRGISDNYQKHAHINLDEPALASEALKTGTTINRRDIFDSTENPGFKLLDDARIEGWQSALIVPLRTSNEKPLGTLHLYGRKQGAFSQTQVDLVESIANQAAVELQKIDLYEKVLTRGKQLEKLHDIVDKTMRMQDPKDVLPILVESVVNLLGSNASAVINPYDPKKQEFSTAQYAAGPAKEYLLHTHPPRRTGGVSMHVLKTKRPLFVEQADDNPFTIRKTLEEGLKSFACLPLFSGDEALGTLYIRFEKQHQFHEEEKNLLTLYAREAATALQNARLHRRRVDHNAALQSVIAAIGSNDDPLPIILQQSVELFGVEYGSLTLADVARQVREPYAIWADGLMQVGDNIPQDMRRLKWTGGIVGHVIQTGKSFRTGDVTKVDFYRKKRKSTMSELAVPIKNRMGTVVGIVNLESSISDCFSEAEEVLCQDLAKVAATVIEKSRLFQEARERAIQLEELQRAIAAIAREVKLEKVSQQILGSLAGIFGGAQCGFRTYDAKTGMFGDQLTTPDVPEDIKAIYPGSKGISRYVVDHKVPYFIGDVADQIPEKLPKLQPKLIEKGVKAFACLPLVHNGEVSGILSIGLWQPHEFTKTERQILELFTDHVSIAIEKAELFGQIEERALRLRELHNITARILREPTNPDKVCEDVLDSIMHVFNGARGAIRLYDADSNTYLKWISKDLDSNVWDSPPRPDGTSAYIVREKKPIFIENAEAKLETGVPGIRPEFRDLNVKAIAHLPLLAGDKVIGLLYLDLTEPHHFSENDQLFLNLFVNQAVIAIENARAFQMLDEKARQLVRLQEVATTISAEPSNIKKVLGLITDGLGSMFKRASCTIRMYDSLTDTFGQRIATGELKDQLSHDPRAEGTSRYVIRTQAPYYTEDTSIRPPDGQPTIRQEILDLGVRAGAALPLLSKGKLIGILRLALTEPHHFSQGEKQILNLFANQAAIAIENTRLYEHISQNLERRIRELEVLSEIYEKIIRVGIESVDQILDLVYIQMAQVMDLTDAQVQFAFYNEVKDEVSFPLAVELDDGITIDVVRWGRREQPYIRPGEDEHVTKLQPRSRRERLGLTEYVILRQQPKLIPGNFIDVAQGLEIEGRQVKVWSTFGRKERPTHSWLGVPMMAAGHVIGVISIQSLEQERVFDENHKDLLAVVANQAAIAIENTRLYDTVRVRGDQLERTLNQLKEAQEKARAIDRLNLMSQVGAEFTHKMNNLAGTIPVRVEYLHNKLREYGITDSLTLGMLSGISSDADGLLQAAQQIRNATGPEASTKVDLGELIRGAVERARKARPAMATISVQDQLLDDMPKVTVPRNRILETFDNLILNAVEAMDKQGTLTLKSALAYRDGKDYVSITIADTGCGIPKSNLPKIFDLAFTTKTDGLGFGLWRDKNLLTELGGDIEVESEEGKGSSFTIFLPHNS